MAFAVVASGVKAFGVERSEPVTNRFKQVFILPFTAATSDVALDIGNLSGTFWTAVANAEVKAVWANIQAKLEYVTSLTCPQIKDAKVKVGSGATLATGQFKEVSTPSGLAITLYASEGVTSGTIVIEGWLKSGVNPEQYQIT